MCPQCDAQRGVRGEPVERLGEGGGVPLRHEAAGETNREGARGMRLRRRVKAVGVGAELGDYGGLAAEAFLAQHADRGLGSADAPGCGAVDVRLQPAKGGWVRATEVLP